MVFIFGVILILVLGWICNKLFGPIRLWGHKEAEDKSFGHRMVSRDITGRAIDETGRWID